MSERDREIAVKYLMGTSIDIPNDLAALFSKVRAEGLAAGRAEERAAVVAWLRSTWGEYAVKSGTADDIESGEHLSRVTADEEKT